MHSYCCEKQHCHDVLDVGGSVTIALLCDVLGIAGRAQDKVESPPAVLKNSNQEMVSLLMNDKDGYRNITT